MTEVLAPSRVHGVTIRAYRPSDHNSCRRLWAELNEHRSSLYGEQVSDTGAGFEEYLTQLNLSGIWVAEHAEEGVAGFLGLMLDGRAGEVDPVIVTASMRGRGIGQALLAKVADEASRRGLSRLTVSPTVRDVYALRALHTAGFATVASVTLAYDLSGSATRGGAAPKEEPTLDLFDLRFAV
jgi:N-acetylglutamate synthase-like GNAT family acetyltransferase